MEEDYDEQRGRRKGVNEIEQRDEDKDGQEHKKE